MTNYKNQSLFVISILVFAVLGCKLFSDQRNEPETNPDENTQEEIVLNDDSHTNTTTLNDEEIDGDDPTEGQRKIRSKRKTVRFARNTTSKTYSDLVYNTGKHTYILEAAKGQKMSVKVGAVDSNAVFIIKKPKGGFLYGGSTKKTSGPYSGTLPESGKYQIEVSSTFENASYNITFSVTGTPEEKAKDNSSTVESVGGLTTVVKFKKGATSASYKNAVVRGQRNKYILGAKGGQLMSVSISSLENNAVFDIQAPDGRILVNEKRSWSGQLPADGKYRIIVGGTRGNATYTVRFAVR